jgi:hypothetical protein
MDNRRNFAINLQYNQAGCDFEPALAFEGSREGMVFKMGPKGLGYYTDQPSPPSRYRAMSMQKLTFRMGQHNLTRGGLMSKNIGEGGFISMSTLENVSKELSDNSSIQAPQATVCTVPAQLSDHRTLPQIMASKYTMNIAAVLKKISNPEGIQFFHRPGSLRRNSALISSLGLKCSIKHCHSVGRGSYVALFRCTEKSPQYTFREQTARDNILYTCPMKFKAEFIPSPSILAAMQQDAALRESGKRVPGKSGHTVAAIRSCTETLYNLENTSPDPTDLVHIGEVYYLAGNGHMHTVAAHRATEKKHKRKQFAKAKNS